MNEENNERKNKMLMAEDPLTSPEMLKKLAEENDYDIKIKIAHNPSTPPEILKKLAEENDYDINNAIAKNPSITLEIIKIFCLEDYDDDIHHDAIIEALHNESMTYDMLQELEKEISKEKEQFRLIRCAMALRDDTPIERLKEFLKDDDSELRELMSARDNIPFEILKELLTDKEAKTFIHKPIGYLEVVSSLEEVEKMRNVLQAEKQQKEAELKELTKKRQMIEEIRGLIEQNNQLEQQITELREAQKEETSK